jgi:hypothetical protein
MNEGKNYKLVASATEVKIVVNKLVRVVMGTVKGAHKKKFLMSCAFH